MEDMKFINAQMPNKQNKFTTSRISKKGGIKQMHQYQPFYTIFYTPWWWVIKARNLWELVAFVIVL